MPRCIKGFFSELLDLRERSEGYFFDRKAAGISGQKLQIDFVANQHLVYSEDWSLVVAGGILFSENSPALLPRKCGVRIARYETRDDDPEREHLKESYYLEGPAYRLIHKSVEKITSILSGISVGTDHGTEKKGYPPEAIWEVFVNAIIHRDYGKRCSAALRLPR